MSTEHVMANEQHFGKWLRREIENRCLTQKEFASRGGFHREALRKWIASPRPAIRGDMIGRIASALEIDRTELDERLGLTSAA